MIASILFVPSEEWRARMLAPGARVSEYTVQHSRRHGWATTEWTRHGDVLVGWIEGGWASVPTQWLDGPSLALVLAHDGVVVREGRDRVAYCLAEREELPCPLGAPTWIPPEEWDEGFILMAWQTSRESDQDCRVYYASDKSSPGYVRSLAFESSALPAALRPAWALAIVCAARKMGRVVLLGEDGSEDNI